MNWKSNDFLANRHWCSVDCCLKCLCYSHFISFALNRCFFFLLLYNSPSVHWLSSSNSGTVFCKMVQPACHNVNFYSRDGEFKGKCAEFNTSEFP